MIGLVACGATTLAVYVVGFWLPYPLGSGLTRPLQHFGRLTGPSIAPTITLVAALGALFLLYVAALRICGYFEDSRAAMAIVLGGGALSALALLPMYPV